MALFNFWPFKKYRQNPGKRDKYREIFDLAPVSIWEEDLSDIYHYIQHLKSKGITDFESFVKTHPQELLSVSAMIKVVNVNETTLKMYEADSKEQMLASISKVFLPDSFDVFGKEFIAIANGAKEFAAESSNRTLKGRRIDIYISLNIPTKESDFKNLLVSISDITEFKAVERQYKEQLHRNQLILQTTLDGYLLAEMNGQLVDVNNAYCSIIGYSRDELLKMNIYQLEMTLSQAEIDRRIKVFYEKGFDKFKTIHRSKNGSMKHLDVSVAMIEYQGINLVSAFVRDISEQVLAENALKESEKNLKEAQRIAQIGNWQYDIANKKLSWSDQVYKLFRVDPAEFEVDFEQILELVHPEDIQLVHETIKGAANNNQRSQMVFRCFLPDHSLRYYDAQAEPLFDENGQALKFIGTIQDVTEKETTLGALRESEERFRSLVTTAPDFISIVDKNYKLQFINRVAEGFSMEDVIGKSVFDFTDPVFHSLIEEKIDSVFKSGKTVDYETVGKGDDGEDRWYSTRIGPIIQDGEIVMVNMLSSDITSQKLNEIEIRQTSEEISAIAEIIKTVTTDLNIDVLLDEALKGTLALTGLEGGTICLIEGTKTELPVLNLKAHNNTSAETVEEFSKNQIHVGECLCGSVAVTNEPLILWDNASGSEYATLESVRNEGIRFHAAFPLSIRSKPIGVLCLFAKSSFKPEQRRLDLVSDLCNTLGLAIENAQLYKNTKQHAIALEQEISTRKNAELALRLSEQRFRHLVDRGWDLIVLSDEKGNIKYVNGAIQRVLGFTPEEFIRNAGFELVYEQDLKKVMTAVSELLKKPATISFEEYRVLHKNGEARWLEVVGSNFLNDPSVNAIVANCRDITERKQSEEKIRRAQDKLKKNRAQLRNLAGHLQTVREEERRSIAREIHDELAQVLTALKFDLSILGDEISGKRGTVNINEQLKEIESMKELINRTIKEVRSIITTLRPDILDKLGLLDTLEWQFKEFESHTGMTTDYKCEVTVLDIEEQKVTAIFRIVQEALTNIARHSNADSVDAILQVKNNVLQVDIHDNGKGFEENSSDSEGHYGILGMTERAIILGGDVKIKSDKKKGTTVSVRMPLN